MELLIADDHPGFQNVLRQAIEEERSVNWCVVRKVGNGEEVLELCKTAEPEVVILDVNMPTLDGLAALRLLRHRHPSVRERSAQQSNRRRAHNDLQPLSHTVVPGKALSESGPTSVLSAREPPSTFRRMPTRPLG